MEIDEDFLRKTEHLATKEDIKAVIEFTKNEIKHIIELMDKRFEAVDKRFEAIDKRFEDIQHQMNRQTTFMIIGFTILSVLIAIFGMK